MIKIGLLPDDQAHVDNTIKSIQNLIKGLSKSEMSFEEFIIAANDPNHICSRIMDLNLSIVNEELVAEAWGVPYEKNIRYLINSISMLIYDRLSNSNSAIRRLWVEIILLEAFKDHPAQLVIISTPFHTPTSFIYGRRYCYWEPMETDAFYIVDNSVVISETVQEEDAVKLQPFIDAFNTWENIEKEIMVKTLNKALRCKTMIELLTTIRDSICVKWLQNPMKVKGEFYSNNLVFTTTFNTIKNII